MIGISNLSKGFGAQTLFDDVTLQLDAGKRYGLVGANGSGKTTFLKILSGSEPASGGEVKFQKRARIGVLRQDRFESDDQIILDVAMMGDELVHRALAEQDALSSEEEPSPERIAEIDEILRAHDGYTFESRAAQVLMGLGIAESSIRRPLSTLSGGYKLRVLLAQVLVGRPDAILLDEPTNHLDILSIRWLERFLNAYRGCAVVISHDQRFLNTIATHILDVDYATIIEYPGNYAAFHELKLATRERKEAEIARVEKIIAEKKAFVERFRAKASKARQAQSRVKQIEKIEVEKLAPSSRRYPKFRFDMVRPSGKDVLDARRCRQVLRRKPSAHGRVADHPTRGARGGDRRERPRQVHAAQDRRRQPERDARRGGVGPRDPRRLLRAGPSGPAHESRARPRSTICGTSARRRARASCAERWGGCCFRATTSKRRSHP